MLIAKNHQVSSCFTTNSPQKRQGHKPASLNLTAVLMGRGARIASTQGARCGTKIPIIGEMVECPVFFFKVMFDDVQIVRFFNVSFDLKIPWLFLDGLKLLSFFMI
jgi:hypothetical protein